MRIILTVIMLLFAFSGAYSEDRSKILERHALAATPKDEKTLESLARYLSQGRPHTIFDKRVNFWTTNSAGDEATAREIFVWVASRISYLDLAWPQRSPSDLAARIVLDSRVGVCHDYAVLYSTLACKAGLRAEYVCGTARVGREAPDRHAWNAVLIGGKWRMVDACWGRTPIPNKIDYQWLLVDPESFTESHLPLESIFRDRPCGEYLRTMNKKKLAQIRKKMGTPAPNDDEQVVEL